MVNESRFMVGCPAEILRMSVPRYDQYPAPSVRAIRTWASELVSTKLALMRDDHAFMFWRMRSLRSRGGLSRKPTVSLTPFACQYLVVTTDMRSCLRAKLGMTLSSRC